MLIGTSVDQEMDHTLEKGNEATASIIDGTKMGPYALEVLCFDRCFRRSMDGIFSKGDETAA